MDIKELIEKAVDKIKDDKALQAQFKKDPIKALENLWLTLSRYSVVFIFVFSGLSVIHCLINLC